MKRVEPGRLFLVRNKEKTPAANSDYVFVLLEGGKGVKPYLFTDTQIRVARERAAKNPEDCLKRRKKFLGIF